MIARLTRTERELILLVLTALTVVALAIVQAFRASKGLPLTGLVDRVVAPATESVPLPA